VRSYTVPAGGRMKVNERRTVVGGLIGHSTGRRSLHGWGDTSVSPQPWREIDAHVCRVQCLIVEESTERDEGN